MFQQQLLVKAANFYFNKIVGIPVINLIKLQIMLKLHIKTQVLLAFYVIKNAKHVRHLHLIAVNVN